MCGPWGELVMAGGMAGGELRRCDRCDGIFPFVF